MAKLKITWVENGWCSEELPTNHTPTDVSDAMHRAMGTVASRVNIVPESIRFSVEEDEKA